MGTLKKNNCNNCNCNGQAGNNSSKWQIINKIQHFKSDSSAMPNLGKGTECIKFLLS